MRRRVDSPLEHARLRWYRERTLSYRLTSRYVVPAALRLSARVEVEGLEHVPAAGPAILAANHPDNWDGYLLLHLVPRTVHVAARPDAFGTGPLCAFWRRLAVFPADPWGLRYALGLLVEERVVAVFPRAGIAHELGGGTSAVGLLALRTGAPVVPVAIAGTEAIRVPPRALGRTRVLVRFGPPVKFSRDGANGLTRHAVSLDAPRRLGGVLPAATT
jgi:1-acyl-sn-glycerol-3-phosphate acyltransferase